LIINPDKYGRFKLTEAFLEPYRKRSVKWGFGPLSWVTFKRTYSRNGEQWGETCRRVIEGMFTVQKVHCFGNNLPWDDKKARALAHSAYDRMWNFKWSPPGRGLWIMGTRFMYERGGAALNNCGFVSTSSIDSDLAAPFVWMLRMSMLGVGVGFDTRGRGRTSLQPPVIGEDVHYIGDSRDDWAKALERHIKAYAGENTLPADWDFSGIRPAGEPLKSFGGYASGPEPLRKMLRTLRVLHDSYVDKKVDARLIVDTMNIIGRCVIAGGIRRSAQVAFGAAQDPQFLDLKSDPRKTRAWRWVSNNSIFAEPGMDYTEPTSRTRINGEPGYLWLENARARGRMKDPPNWADEGAMGSNPCVEQTLWDKELCCLVETYPAHHDKLNDYLKTLEIAYLYAKTVTLIPTLEPETNEIIRRHRRIGCSMSGIVQAINRFGDKQFFNWCDKDYAFSRRLDKDYSAWLQVPRSLKITTVKPSGTVSLLAGATPGVHWEHAPFYIRRIRVSNNNPVGEVCRQAGYRIEPDYYADNTQVIEFPVYTPYLKHSKSEIPVGRKVEIAAMMQHYWSDNQVSSTADFQPEKEGEKLSELLSTWDTRLKSIVFLPSQTHGYHQAPYEQISREEYKKRQAELKPIHGKISHEPEMEARFCEDRHCIP